MPAKEKAKGEKGDCKLQANAWMNDEAAACQRPNISCRAMQFNDIAGKRRICKTSRLREVPAQAAQEGQALQELLPM